MPTIRKNIGNVIGINEIDIPELSEGVNNLKPQIIHALELQDTDNNDIILEKILTKTPEEIRALFSSVAPEVGCTQMGRALLFLLIGYKLDFDSKIGSNNLELQANPIFQLYKKEELFYNLYQEYTKLENRRQSQLLVSVALYMNETTIPVSNLAGESESNAKKSDYFIDSKKLFQEIKNNPDNEESMQKLLFVSSFQYFGIKPKFLSDTFDPIPGIQCDNVSSYIADFSSFKAYLVCELGSELGILIFNTLIERQFQAFKKNNEFLVALFDNPDLCILPYISDDSAYELYCEIDTHLKQGYKSKQCLISGKYDTERKIKLESVEATVMQRYESQKENFSNRKYSDYLNKALEQGLNVYLTEAKSDDLDEIIGNNPILRVNTYAEVTQRNYIKLDISNDRDTIYGALLYLKGSHFDRKKLKKLIKSFIELASSELKKANSPHGYFVKLIFFLISIDQSLFIDKSCKKTMQDYFIENKDCIIENLGLLGITNDNNYRKFESTRSAKSYINIIDNCPQEWREQFISDILFSGTLGQYIESLEVTTIKKILKSFSIIPESELFKELSIKCDKDSIQGDLMSSSKFEYINSRVELYRPGTNPLLRMDGLPYHLKTGLIYPPNVRNIEFSDDERALIIKEWLTNKVLKNPYLLSQLICKLKKDSSKDKRVGLEILKYEEEFGLIGTNEILECAKDTKFQSVQQQEDSYTRNKVIGGFDTQPGRVMAYVAVLLHSLNKDFDIRLLYNECPTPEQKDSFIFSLLGSKEGLECNLPFLDNKILDKAYRKYNEGDNKLSSVSIISGLGINNKHLFGFADLIYDKMKTFVHENNYIEAARIYIHFMELYLENIQDSDPNAVVLTNYFDSLDSGGVVFKAIHNGLAEITPKNDVIDSVISTYFSVE